MAGTFKVPKQNHNFCAAFLKSIKSFQDRNVRDPDRDRYKPRVYKAGHKNGIETKTGVENYDTLKWHPPQHHTYQKRAYQHPSSKKIIIPSKSHMYKLY